ncbi:hypothetical protein AYM40_00445 [Paraburkholderia phytofirmans OLGA172]|uniref:Uncharacterized protein n=1 Tax=Paraburkholderia phytofirmans OLGA172 TaxID=1417228 RepID=A0A167VP76_9BURK|nr:hypothetical protein AYM40_00445 [Paraburkholderia phytofirmans OLGA172]
MAGGAGFAHCAMGGFSQRRPASKPIAVQNCPRIGRTADCRPTAARQSWHHFLIQAEVKPPARHEIVNFPLRKQRALSALRSGVRLRHAPGAVRLLVPRDAGLGGRQA